MRENLPDFTQFSAISSLLRVVFRFFAHHMTESMHNFLVQFKFIGVFQTP